MTAPLRRVAFAGLAHSHPVSDATNVRSFGGEVAAVWDPDAAAAAAFVARFGGVVVNSLHDLRGRRADVVIATPRTPEAASVLAGLAGGPPVFVNKVIAATAGQLAAIDRVARDAAFGTASVLRFAPALKELADRIAGREVRGVHLRVQHDGSGFRLPGREWQDDPGLGGGTLVTIGLHAWEMLDVMLPGARLRSSNGRTRRSAGSTTRSEDAAVLEASVAVDGRRLPVRVDVTALPGPDVYGIDVHTADGDETAELDVANPMEELGFRGLIRELLRGPREQRVVAPWSQARVVVENSIRAATLARGTGPEGSGG